MDSLPKPGEITQATNELQKVVATAHDELSMFLDKLNPVLGPQTDRVENPDREFASALGHDLHGVLGDAEALVNRIREASGRVHV